MRSELSLDLSSPTTLPLEIRIAEFKHDPQKMDEMAHFVDGIVREAQNEVEHKLDNKMVSYLQFICMYNVYTYYVYYKHPHIISHISSFYTIFFIQLLYFPFCIKFIFHYFFYKIKN